MRCTQGFLVGKKARHISFYTFRRGGIFYHAVDNDNEGYYILFRGLVY